MLGRSSVLAAVSHECAAGEMKDWLTVHSVDRTNCCWAGEGTGEPRYCWAEDGAGNEPRHCWMTHAAGGTRYRSAGECTGTGFLWKQQVEWYNFVSPSLSVSLPLLSLSVFWLERARVKAKAGSLRRDTYTSCLFFT